MDESLWHPVPRLDAPDRLWLLPAPQAKWLAAGIFTGPLAAQLLVFFGGEDPAGVWSLLALWLVWGLAASPCGGQGRPASLGVLLAPQSLVAERIVL